MNDRASIPASILPTALTDSAPVAIYHYTGPGRPLYANPAFRAMFGVEAAQNIDVWVMKIHPDDRERARQEWARFESQLESGVDEFRTQYRILGSAGESRVVLERVVRAVGVDGFVGTITDVTELVQTQTELERAHKALMSASHRAGMAEVATNVLHNVGNVLNTVNVSANVLEARLGELRVAGLGKIATMLQEKGEALSAFMSTERGKGLPGYLARLSSELQADKETALTELASLVENLEHIKNIVRMQQSYASSDIGVTETVALGDLINDGVRLNAAGFSRHGVTLELDFGEVPSITVDKHKVLQILVNVLSNAKYACDNSKHSDRRVVISTRPSEVGVCITVRDNGVGIPAENMTRIFEHGFTTRPDGHGFGLHSAAIAAKELKGSLRAASDGPGCGASFTLELPLQPSGRST
jgi:PAS domain S-box-containing protein